MEDKKSYTITKYIDGVESSVEDDVVTEARLQVIINGKKFLSLLCTPKALPALVTGFLFTEGVLTTIEEIDQLTIDELAGTAEVTLVNKETYKFINDILCGERTVTTGCGRGRTITYPLMSAQQAHPTMMKLDYDKILDLFKVFNSASELFQATGGVHSCALCDREQILYSEEDIGRHNAVDKVIGLALMHGVELQDKILLTSGRVSSEIIGKLARSGIHVIVSRSAPTDTAIEIARNRGMRLIGFARGRRLNIYS